MALAQQIVVHLPYLRRYARALTGSQKSGDAYIRATLSALTSDSHTLEDNDMEIRQNLYKLFHTIWVETGAKLEGRELETTSETLSPDQHLKKITPINRQAFLLFTLEGFGLEEVASILSKTNGEIRELIDMAHKDIETSLETKILIIEDEPIIAADLEGIVKELGHEVTGIATTYQEALDMAKETSPGIILCDIQLADNSSGIDAANDILARMDIPEIFITAFPERLLTGEKPEPTFLITKPFQENTVKATIGQALFFHQT